MARTPNTNDGAVDNSRIRNWLANVSLFFYRHKALSLMLVLTLLIFGALSYTTLLKREGFPPIEVPVTLVKGTYLVDNAQQVDEKVAVPLSKILGEIDGVDSVMTSAHDNFFTAVVFTNDSVGSSADAIALINKTIEDSSSLPSDVKVEVDAINPSKYYNTYDSVAAVYSVDNSLDTAALAKSAEVVEVNVSGSEDVAAAEVMEQSSAGVNPVTGQQVYAQSSFGRVGMPNEKGEFVLHDAVYVGIVAEDEVGTLDLADSVDAVLVQTNASGEMNGATAMVSVDSSHIIENQIYSLQSNMLTALAAVIVITMVFISIRASLTTAIFMVTVMATTLGILFLIGYSLNTIILFGLVLALGLFIDDATIITEALDANKKLRNPEKSIRRAISKVALASFAGTATTVLVFTPLLFLSGILGEFIRLLPVTVIISLLVSLVLSLTLIPFLSRYTVLSKGGLRRIGKTNPINRAEKAMARFFADVPMLLKTRRKTGIIVATLLVVFSLFSILAAGKLASGLDFNIFPPADDSDTIVATVAYQPGTTIDQAQTIADELSVEMVKIIEEPNIVGVTYGVRQKSSVRLNEILFTLKAFTDRDKTSPQMIDEINQALAGYDKARVRVDQVDSGPPTEEMPFKMQIFGEDTKAIAVFGGDVVMYLDGNIVTMQNGKTANITKTELAYVNQYERIDGNRYVEVKAGYDSNNVSALVESTQKMVESEFSEQDLNAYGLSYADESVTFDFGQESDNAESFKSVLLIVPLALALMFVLLTFQFRSLIKPLIIFMAIPFSLFGVFFGLTITGNPMSFFVMIGLIGLIGIVVNNAILLVDYANQDRAKGMDATEAVSTALYERFRPLITTTTITVVALAPLAIYDPFWEPLAVTIMFGLLSSTIMVLIAFPYYYIMADNIGTWIKSQTKKIFHRK